MARLPAREAAGTAAPGPAPAEPAARLFAGLQPRYARVAASLAAAIMAGEHGVGGMLPPEGRLCATFGVSRSTVREALRRLAELGLVAPTRGVGTRVLAAVPRGSYVLAARSAMEVMGYAGATWLEITGRHSLRATAALARELDLPPGSRWRRVVGVRRTEPERTALSCVSLYIAHAYADVADSPELATTPAYRLIGQSRGIPVCEIRQEIAAVTLDAGQAAALGSRAGEPGLHIRRRFYAGDGTLLEATVNVHAAADRFSYSLRLGSQP